MRRKKIYAAVIAIVFMMAGTTAFGAKKISIELGEEMFNDPALSDSTNESSCSSCHAGGKGLEEVNSREKLTKLINNCLVGNMAGNKLDGRKAPMRSLKIYIKSLHEE